MLKVVGVVVAVVDSGKDDVRGSLVVVIDGCRNSS